jgi:hypothetical protein
MGVHSAHPVQNPIDFLRRNPREVALATRNFDIESLASLLTSPSRMQMIGF